MNTKWASDNFGWNLEKFEKSEKELNEFKLELEDASLLIQLNLEKSINNLKA